VTEALYASLRERQAPIGVTLLCPGLVNTRIYESERNRPQHLRSASGPAAETPQLQTIAAELFANALSPEAVAEQVFDAVQAGRLYQLTSDRYDDTMRDRAQAILERRNPEFPSLLDLSTRDRKAP
jgi:short-subunit dehydrogenase